MAVILNIETSTINCSVALSVDGNSVCLKEHSEEGYSHGENLHVFIDEVISESGYALNELDAISVSMGPGSYTGLRIGISAAKGLCYSLGLPLISLSTLEILAYQVNLTNKGYVIPVLDARRKEVYSAVFSESHQLERSIEAEIIKEYSYQSFLTKGKVYVIGNAANKVKSILNKEIASRIEFTETLPSSGEMAELSEKKFKTSDFENVAYFEPYYLKDFIAIKPKPHF